MTQALERPVTAPDTQDEDPQLSFETHTRPEDKIDALKLIGDSIAQPRQIASRHLIFHSLCLGVFSGVLSIAHIALGLAKDDYVSMVITYSGFVLAYFLAIRYLAGPYIHIA